MHNPKTLIEYALSLEPPLDWQFMNEVVEYRFYHENGFYRPTFEKKSDYQVLSDYEFTIDYKIFNKTEFRDRWPSRGSFTAGTRFFEGAFVFLDDFDPVTNKKIPYTMKKFIDSYDINPLSNTDFLILPIHRYRVKPCNF